MYRIAVLCLLLLHFISATAQLQPVGNWREHLPWHQALQVLNTSDKIWCATPYSLFSTDPEDNTIERKSKITGLSSTGISSIATDATTGKIIIGYKNSNVDILNDAQVV